MRQLRLTIILALLLAGCATASVERTTETHSPDGTIRISRTKFSTFALYKDAVKQGLENMGEIGSTLWDMVPGSVKAVGLGVLGIGGVGGAVGFHGSRVRKHKERSFNKALSLRLGPPEVKP